MIETGTIVVEATVIPGLCRRLTGLMSSGTPFSIVLVGLSAVSREIGLWLPLVAGR
jgi:hypothetical protein